MARPPDAGRISDMAEDLDATMSQLRASVRLCRLWRDQGKPGEVSRPRRALYETFTEGFATARLLEARGIPDSRF
jgi:predicted ATPase